MVFHHFTVTAIATAGIALALGYFVLVEAKRQTGNLRILGKFIGWTILIGLVFVSVLRFIKVVSLLFRLY